MKRLLCWALAAVSILAGSLLAAEETPGVYVILDGSGSMWGQLEDGTHKITAAREVVKGFVAEDYAGRELALRVYGHRREGDCSDTELVVPFSTPEAAISQMRTFADGVNPKGKTPISRSLRAALADFGDRPGELILISDGIETCDEDPCALVREWQGKNVQIRVHVVGLGLEDKERLAMQCISDAAGTEYRDVGSADELAAGLREIQQSTSAPDSANGSEWRVLDILATNEAGEQMRVQGTARQEGGEPFEVSSNGHNTVPEGEFEVTVGVRTRNGTLYKPVTRTVKVEGDGATKLNMVVPEPPSVRARFVEAGEAHKGAHVTAYQEDKEVLGFRAKDRAYLEPGTYEFRSQPNADNDLAVKETFADGDHKEILFELAATVRVKITMVSAGSDIEFRSNFELWQNGEKKYGVHRHNGVQALPGTYDLRLPLYLTPHEHPGLVVTTEAVQEHRIVVPVGHLTVRYQNADGSAGEDGRCWVERKDEKGKWVKDRTSTSGVRIPLVGGEYRLKGWSRFGDFDEVFFEMAVGEEKELILRSKGD
ncbi:MAG: hypothetical protein K0U98_08275 [Deltaproteobacteria bacterium]|nr:hypothetical protein [Deltaproteobacteria bacterium]